MLVALHGEYPARKADPLGRKSSRELAEAKRMEEEIQVVAPNDKAGSTPTFSTSRREELTDWIVDKVRSEGSE